MFTGPNIITDGVVLALDAANVKSFPGEPTINLANTNTARTMFLHYSSHAMTFSDAPEKGDGWKKITVTTVSAGNNRLAQFPYITSKIGQRTYSVEYDVGTLGRYKWKVDGSGGYEIIPITGQGKFQFTVTHGSVGSFALFLINQTPATGLNDVVYYRYYQVEDKPIATTFTTSTRGTTVATGGGWADKSGNSNHGELINGPTYNSENGGSIVFDGTDNRITIPHNSSIGMSDNFTFSILVKSSTWTSGNQEGLVQKGTISNYGAYLRGGGGTVSFYTSPTSYWAPGPDIGGDGRWHLLTFVYSYSQLGYKQVYVDGLYHSQLAVTVPITSNTLDIQIGFASVGAPQYLNAEVANYILYNRVLTSQEILQNFNATKSRFGL